MSCTEICSFFNINKFQIILFIDRKAELQTTKTSGTSEMHDHTKPSCQYFVDGIICERARINRYKSSFTDV